VRQGNVIPVISRVSSRLEENASFSFFQGKLDRAVTVFLFGVSPKKNDLSSGTFLSFVGPGSLAGF
jgi:hypothetical protein